ncbi:phospholipase A [Acinetobacter sp. B5B]|uniref:phospholipase A n=1 Tax=Acinetobacter baretiae TaxID=2605383 RepID=UPI0018C1E5A5|nr:phospholipase A [Acinetobacter baretiae]MBF7683125.1 phospholipase A [Acinetobacter baretiae]MBF7684519.1 phospholipase A [Acinetobacter baretiae]
MLLCQINKNYKPALVTFSLLFEVLCLSQRSYAVNTAQSLQPASAQACSAIAFNADRLACYDQYFGLPKTTVVNQVDNTPVVNASSNHLVNKLKDAVRPIYANDIGQSASPTTSLLDSRWELSEASKLGTWNVRSYKPVYVLPVFWSSEKNSMPYSPNPENQVPYQSLNSTELKFQLSLKTKIWENIFPDNGDLWLGYTQSSRWQAYNEKNSSPFRETNYEPEANLIFRTNYKLFGLDGRLLGLTLNHQSNGQSDPYSRSWNRVMLNLGLERGNFAMMIRPWYRIPESARNDNNPDIQNYMGRADVTTFYKWNDHQFSVMLRHTLKGGHNSRGAMQVDWTFPIKGNLRGQLQYFNGYGESLIDYNHRANYVGLGISLLDWY